jgi:hypothetical protein
VDIPAKRVPYFKPGKELKELINADGANGADNSEAVPESASGAASEG